MEIYPQIIKWLEEGNLDNGWQHLKTKHVDSGQFRKAGIPDDQVQNKIFESIKNLEKNLQKFI